MKSKFLLLISVFVVLTSTFDSKPALAHPRDQRYRDYRRREKMKQEGSFGYMFGAGAAVEKTFEQTLNPDDPKDTRTFKQHYWIDSSLAAGLESPVFLDLCGEWTCSASEMNWMREFAATYKAHLVTLEHRYYGQSQPFTSLTVDHLKYLKTEYAVSDIARFSRYAMATLGLKGKWIVVGASYSASLAAYYRLKYPELVAGALASSAPVEAFSNFEEYDHHVNQVVSPKCGSAIRQVVKIVDAAVHDPRELLRIKTLFQSQDVADTGDFLMIMGDMSGGPVQYGFQNEFCDELVSAADPVAGFASAGIKGFAKIGQTPFQDSFQASLNVGDFSGTRAWNYQSCTEFGYWQTAYHNPGEATRSQGLNMAYFNNVCKRLYGMSKTVDTDTINKEFYIPLLILPVNHLMFSNGSDDPWSNLSITKERGNSTDPFLTLYTVVGGSHTEDLDPPALSDSPSLKEARATFGNLLADWLK